MRTIRKKLRPAVLVVALVLPLFAAAEPAAAVDAVAGDTTFTGTAFLPTFPCPTPLTSAGSCGGGSFSGWWTGHLTGLYDSAPFEVSWTTTPVTTPTPPVTATFSYGEFMCQGVETVLGGAAGSGSATAGPSQELGFWAGGAIGDLPRAITGVRLLFGFEWVRVANVAVLKITPGSTLDIEIAGLGWRTVSRSEQTGVATFVPVSASGTVLPSCDTPLSNVNGVITGDVTLR